MGRIRLSKVGLRCRGDPNGPSWPGGALALRLIGRYLSLSQMQVTGINAVRTAATILTPAKPEASKTRAETAAAVAIPI